MLSPSCYSEPLPICTSSKYGATLAFIWCHFSDHLANIKLLREILGSLAGKRFTEFTSEVLTLSVVNRFFSLKTAAWCSSKQHYVMESEQESCGLANIELKDYEALWGWRETTESGDNPPLVHLYAVSLLFSCERSIQNLEKVKKYR